MSRIEERLAELGLTLPAVAAPVAAYVPAVLDGDLVWTSGQLPFVNGELVRTGKVGNPVLDPALVDAEEAADLARICGLNAIAALGSVVDLDRIERIVKVVGFVASHPSFTDQPIVINGVSLLLGEVFGAAGAHARSAVGVAALPKDAPVEVEVIARLRS